MTALAFQTYDVNAALAERLRGFAAKALGRKAGGASARTAKGWLNAEAGPIWKHTVAMLNDDELCARLLEAAGRGDLARWAETIAALKAVIAAEGK